MRYIHLVLFALCVLVLNGCFFTKVVTVPMRLGGTIISVVPVVGNTAHDAIDKMAEIVDEVPL